jgi:hypothetical protein
LVGIGFAAAAFKIQDAIVVMMIVIYFLLSTRDGVMTASIGNRDPVSGSEAMPTTDPAGATRQATRVLLRPVHRLQARAAGTVVVTAAAIAGVWTVLQRVTETIDPNKLLVNRQFVVSSISLQEIASTFGAFLAPLPGAFVPTPTRNVWTDDMANLLSWLLVAGVVGGAIFLASNQSIASLARATLLTALFGGPVFVILNFVSMSQYITLPTRYGFPLLPAMVICTADAIRTRWAGILAVSAGLLSVGFVAYQLA